MRTMSGFDDSFDRKDCPICHGPVTTCTGYSGAWRRCSPCGWTSTTVNPIRLPLAGLPEMPQHFMLIEGPYRTPDGTACQYDITIHTVHSGWRERTAVLAVCRSLATATARAKYERTRRGLAYTLPIFVRRPGDLMPPYAAFNTQATTA